MKFISIICPTYNEEKYIANCIDSILASDYPKDLMEVLFVDGRSTDKTRSIIRSYTEKYPFIKQLDNPHRIVPYAMNLGIENSKGDIIIRLDAHASYPKNYFSVLVEGLQKYAADNVGVVCKTDMLNANSKTKAIKHVLSNKFGVGNSLFRVGIDEVTEVDTVPFGCFKKDVFSRFGKYDFRLVRNQDIELNKRIKNGGGKIYLLPDSFCTYYAREEFKPLMKNNYQNGLWNILTLYYTKSLKSLSIRHLVPFAFVSSLVLPLIAALFWKHFIWLSVASLFLYSAVLLWVIKGIREKENVPVLLLARAFLALHLSYGFGSMMAFVKLPFIAKEK